jgi:hypothetical protein
MSADILEIGYGLVSEVLAGITISLRFPFFRDVAQQNYWILLQLAAIYMIVGLKWSRSTKNASGRNHVNRLFGSKPNH